MSKFNSPKNKKMFIKFAQKGEAHVQCMNNYFKQFVKYEYKGMKTLGVTDNTNQKTSKYF